jgi:hypothetical protein
MRIFGGGEEVMVFFARFFVTRVKVDVLDEAEVFIYEAFEFIDDAFFLAFEFDVE